MKISSKVTMMIVSSLLVLGAILVFLNIYEQNKAIEFSTKQLTETVLADKRAALSEEMDIVSNFNIKTLPKVKLNDRFKNFGGLDVGFDKKI